MKILDLLKESIRANLSTCHIEIWNKAIFAAETHKASIKLVGCVDLLGHPADELIGSVYLLCVTIPAQFMRLSN
jgi:hypothetical protein